jgi:ubiquinone/menaquinone biosynthesis C-methylase UbiE
LAPSYDRWYETRLGSFVDRVERQAVFGLLGTEPGELILDVGSGTGRYARELAYRGAQCVGVEPSSAMLAVAQRLTGSGDPCYVHGVAEHLPLASDAFDAVITVTTLEFVADVEAALAEATRVVKPGGRLVLGVLNARGSWAAKRRRRRDAVWKKARFFDQRDVEARLRRFGSVRSQLAVYVPPQLNPAPRFVLGIIEWLGRRFRPSQAAFMAFRVDLRR